MKQHMVIDCPSLTLAFFDPQVMAHRQNADRKWMKNATQVQEDIASGRLGSVPLTRERAFFQVTEGAPLAGAAQTGTVEVKGGSLYFGDLFDLPSSAWGRRRWNFWDWLFAILVLSLIPFGLWLAGFDRQLLLMLIILGAVTVIASAAVAYVFFKGGGDFASRTGTPPKDHPERVLAVEPGTYTWSVLAEGDQLSIVLTRK